MGKARVDKNGRTREQRLIHENQQLKKQIGSLRKQIARLDLDRYSTIKDLIEESYQNEKVAEGKQILETLKKNWTCYECNIGYLEIMLYSKIGETWYIRKCTHCNKRTKGQKYEDSKVKGIVHETQDKKSNK